MTEGYSGNGFDIDLRTGQVSERAFARVLASDTYEVKDEQNQAWETGNVFIEVTQPTSDGGRRFSGINADPPAEVWAFRLDEGSWIVVSYEHLVEAVSDIIDKPGFRGYVWGGDFNKFEGVLVPISRLLHR
jgi:hypothetical protein